MYSHCTEPRINGMIHGSLNLTLDNPVSISFISPFNKTGDDAMINIDRAQDLINGDVIQFTLTSGNKTAGYITVTQQWSVNNYYSDGELVATVISNIY